MNRGEIWLAELGRKRRPVLVLTRSEVIDVRALVTVVEVTTSIRDLASEARFDYSSAGLNQPSVINCDGVHTITMTSLTVYAGVVSDEILERVCAAMSSALGC